MSAFRAVICTQPCVLVHSKAMSRQPLLLAVLLAGCFVTCRGRQHSAKHSDLLSLDTGTGHARGKNDPEFLPVVLWHGMGDSCCATYSIGAVMEDIQRLLPGVFVHSIATGTGERGDIISGFFGSVNDQVEQVCQEIRGMPELQGGYVAVGFSQGGQFLRGVVERCQHLGPKMHTLVTMGAQHQGVMNVPECWMPSFNQTSSLYCRLMQRLLGSGAYNSWVQGHVVQAQYFKDPAHLDQYTQHSAFLADINNEAPDASRRQLYRDNLASLQRLVLFQFDNDVTVVPMESSHFGFFDGTQLLSMEETALYQEDWIGLKELNEGGRLFLDHCPGFHMQFTLDWFEENAIRKYLTVRVDDAAATEPASATLAQL